MRFHLLNRLFLLSLLGACATTSSEVPAVSAPVEDTDSIEMMEEGRELTRKFYAGELDDLWDRMTDEVREALGTEEDLVGFRQMVEAQAGTETKVLDEGVSVSDTFRIYQRKASFSGFGSPIIVQWALDTEGRIAGFFVRPEQ